MNEKTLSKRNSSSGGMGLVTITWVILLILKLTVRPNLKWYWVFSSVWISAGLAILFLLCIGTILLAAVIGIASSSSQMVVGIKSWFKKQTQEDVIDVEAQEDSNDDP